jgi:Ca2+-binding RTX toxin-like protein
MAAGTVVGDSTIGTDTLRSVEAVRGTNFADSYIATGFSGTSTNVGSNGTFNEFTGNGGDDTITGNGNTRLSFSNATAGVTVNIATGNATGDASVGHDTFTGVNAIMGSMFNDTLTGSGSTGTETFTGLGGDDFIDGGNGFDISSYNNIYLTTGAVTVNMAAGTATGDASIGNDTLRSIEGVQGTNFADTFDATGFGLAGALNVGNNGTFNQFEGVGGNDTIIGNGNTRVIYSSATGGVTINLQAGTATGDASVGTDTFSGVNSATGSNSADTYIATGFVGTGASNTGTFNLFEGLGGNDTITGNGNTRVAYTQAAAAVTVDLSLGTAHGTAGGDVAAVGTDTIMGGVNSVQGSNFNDVLIGGGGNELFFGGGGNDTISGGGGNDQITGQAGNDTIDGGSGTDMAIYTGPMSNYTISTPGAGQTQVADSVTTRDGTDILTNVEVLQFSDVSLLLSSGTAGNPIDVSTMGLGVNGAALKGTAGDDHLRVGGSSFGHQLDLGAGNDSVALANGGFFQLNLLNVEHVVGSAGDDTISLVNDASGLSVDLGAGNNTVNLANGVNSLTVANVQNISGTDFSGSSDDTLTLLNDVNGLSVNLANGNNTLNLAAGTNSLVDIFNVQHINGTASDDVLTVTDGIGSPTPVTIDLGGGDNTLNIDVQGADLTLLNVQHLNGNGLNNFFTLENDVSGMAIDLGAGNDNVNLAAGTNSIAISNVENVSFGDFAPGVSSDDTLTLLNDVNGVFVNGANGENTLNLAAGSNSFTDLYNFQHVHGTAGDDVLTITDAIGAPDAVTVDLGAGDDTLNLFVPNTSLNLVGVEHLNGDGQDNSVTILDDVSNLSVDLGGGNDTLWLANGVNSISVANVENVNGSDFTGGISPSDDTLTFVNNVTGVSVNLGDGNNTLNLAAGTNSVENLFNVGHVNGSAGDDVLTINQQASGSTIDMGAGNDTVNFNAPAGNVTVLNAETVNGSNGNDAIIIGNTTGTTTVTGGLGADTITASASADNFHFASAAESAVGAGDQIVNFNATTDNFVFTNMSGPYGFAGPVHFMDTAAFDGTAGAPHSEARVDVSGPNATLQIDVDGDGQMGAHDMEIHLTNYTGTLHDSNFIIS